MGALEAAQTGKALVCSFLELHQQQAQSINDAITELEAAKDHFDEIIDELEESGN